MKHLLKTLPLLFVLTLIGCNGNSKDVNVKPKNGTKVEAAEFFDALAETEESMLSRQAIGIKATKLALDADIKESDVADKKLEPKEDAKIKLSEGSVTMNVKGITKEKNPENATAEIHVDTKVDITLNLVDGEKPADSSIKGQVKPNIYSEKGILYLDLDKGTGDVVKKLAKATGGTVPITFPGQYSLEGAVDFSSFSIDLDAEEMRDGYNALSAEQKQKVTFQKYSDTSYSVWVDHLITEEVEKTEDNKYVLGTEKTDIQASMVIDTKLGITEANFIIEEESSDTVYSELRYQSTFVESDYEEAFLNSEISHQKINGQGSVSFSYDDKVKVTLPDNLDSYSPLMFY